MMKLWRGLTLVVFVVICAGRANATPAMSGGGSSVRGGGDEHALEFQSSFLYALADIKMNYGDLYSQISDSAVYQVAFRTKITVFDGPLYLDDVTKDQNVAALNDPSTLDIILSRPRWVRMDDIAKKGLALHEVLSLVHLENSLQYPFSATYMNYKRMEIDKRENK